MTALVCRGCSEPLVGRRRTWCSAECQKAKAREDWIFKTYGITMEEWEDIFEAQGRVCGICERAPRKKQDGTEETFHLDHEHRDGSAGPVRGILCPYCNTRLVGRLKSHKRAQQLADYLREPPAVRALGREVVAPGRPKKKRQPRKRDRRMK